jgi:hypothetical protein
MSKYQMLTDISSLQLKLAVQTSEINFLRGRVEALEEGAHAVSRAEQLIAAHEGIEHQGLNKGLVEALIFEQGMDPYSALHLLRENKGKS